MKEKILSLTAKNFKWDYYRPSGHGGQHKDKKDTAVRCRHLESGSMGTCEESRSQLRNKEKAFKTCVNSKKFQKWLRIEIAKTCSDYVSIEEQVDKAMDEKNLKIEYLK